MDSTLGGFLRARRAAVDPDAAGVHRDARRRRVPGLRREELAERAKVSVDYIVRIEQGRSRHVSPPVLNALADALMLTADQRAYLHALAAARETESEPVPGIPLGVRKLVSSLRNVPALVLNRGMDVLLWNELAAAVVADFDAMAPRQRNLVRMAFLDSAYRAQFGDEWAEMAREGVAVLRMESGRHPGDAELIALIAELRRTDEQFRRWWDAQAVSGAKVRRKTYHHPAAGPLRMETQLFAVEDRPGLSLVTYTALDEASEEALAKLSAGIR
ncbi:helix-turn-helix domain-containing protein [Actinoplanes sp. TBRC 11911]|uniref:helix-turn-helix domain-containing protein n=1 Tax=Actinoplanes sp. TBRC 11911 TaxID=2729386 RepID=UPI001B7D6245|nr:helix-turn-helix transcriptional regulator [Actinoplanes sp. TBRC 11911]